MAEIKIERKKTGWIWMLLALIVVALLAYFLLFNRDNDTMVITETEYVNDSNRAVATYVNFIENSKGKMSLDHAYTNEALLKLIEATNAKANEVGYEVRADIEKVKEYAEMITKDPFETTHADNIKKADDILTNVLQNIQMEKYPGLVVETEELKNASASIKPGVLTLDQKDAVKNYFAKAADLLQKMN